jgi:hypothetical protein
MKTMIARYPGRCRGCGESIQPGQQINFFGRGTAEHTVCPGGEEQGGEDFDGEDERAGLESGTLANDRRMAKRGLSITRFASGEVSVRCGCIDYPCCGH